MPSVVHVNSSICGFIHIIKGKLDGKNIIIDIETPCSKVKQMSSMEIPMMQTLDIKDNYVMDRAQEARCCPGCILPTGVLHVCRLESGMISKTLAKQVETMTIEFKEAD
ncbi:DUF6951 family protein [Methanolobus vulcani]|uniref:Uncharacterized protein n=1 Tax=Methanolobus vulcani TaxID=38026 RepID=A0A7Z8P3F1_9EURY|nr:hypothetical protein [Methanolobus vulcani]TQD29237.1 hypothetical protein FKV42_00335 [Methanolobus vulcani]